MSWYAHVQLVKLCLEVCSIGGQDCFDLVQDPKLSQINIGGKAIRIQLQCFPVARVQHIGTTWSCNVECEPPADILQGKDMPRTVSRSLLVVT